MGTTPKCLISLRISKGSYLIASSKSYLFVCFHSSLVICLLLQILTLQSLTCWGRWRQRVSTGINKMLQASIYLDLFWINRLLCGFSSIFMRLDYRQPVNSTSSQTFRLINSLYTLSKVISNVAKFTENLDQPIVKESCPFQPCEPISL